MRSDADKESTGSERAQRTEAAGFVAFCVRQIQAAMSETAADMDHLARAVLAVDRQVAEAAGANVETLQAAAREASGKLQSLDRFHQRLGNVCQNLLRVAELMNSSQRPITKESWQAFLAEARGAYTMEAERRMFDAAFECEGSKTRDEREQVASSDLLLF